MISPVQAPLCRALTEDPQALATACKTHEILYKVAAVICGIALVAIFTGAFAIYLGLLSEVPGSVAAAGLISAMVFMRGTSLWQAGNKQVQNAEEFQLIADQLNAIKDYTPEQIAAFYQAHEIELPAVDEPKQLLPLIARFQVLKGRSDKINQIFETHKNGVPTMELEDEAKDALEVKYFGIAHQSLENLAFVQLQMAVVLQNLQFPSKEYKIDMGQVYEDDHSIGAVKTKDPITRAAEMIFDHPQVFFKKPSQVFFTQNQFNVTEPKLLRRMIFDDPPPLEAVP